MLYLAVAAVAVGVAGTLALTEGAAPLAAVARAIESRWLLIVIAAGGTAAMLGVILSQILGLSRMAFAMARRRDLPSFLERTSRFGVPGNAILVTGILGALVAATGALRAVASAAAFTILVYYAIANAAALRMPASAKRFPDAVPVVGLAACTLLALALSREIVGIGLLVLFAGISWRFLARHLGYAARPDSRDPSNPSNP
ncbi:MAG TPA: amino acid permease [Gemmatimonadaceae bacterium]|nr:amino acid permease [Gemmatimonadaceae bacterium]